ncbi:cysteine desulfurase family protein [Zhouia sp. PK063]|uniref:cysteine desulfurase family protein n=1 Tax=Zhouia sp. PK063 TaxID=3373602 RepID=UPI0037B52B2E
MKKVYLDNAATTQIDDEVLKTMQMALATMYGNPSSTHSLGRSAKTSIETARKNIAKLINATPAEIIFTSGGTEADNMILRSSVRDLGVKRIITTKIEHHAVLNTVLQLEKEYHIAVHFLSLNENGDVLINELQQLLQDEVKTLVSLMHINNETGNVTDVKKVAQLCKSYNVLFHTDAVQSVGHYEWDVKETGVDFLSASAHKFHGPKGVGFAYIKNNLGIKPFIFGGEHERGLRAGTEAVHNILGLETAFLKTMKTLEEDQQKVKELKTYFVDKLKSEVPQVAFNGQCDTSENAYTILNLRFPIPENQAAMLLFQFDMNGIACSRGSACQSGSNEPSHVLKEFLSEEDLKKASLRFSLSRLNTKEDVDYTVTTIKKLI